MAETSRSTRLAVTEESTEGTPVVPSAGSDFMAVQDDGLEVSLEFETLENAERRASIGQAKPIQGFESPTGSISHYLKHSGSAATTPDYHLLAKSLFGSTSTRSTERDTVAGSTTSTLVVDAGEGSEFSRGDCVLIKGATSSTSNYDIRPILSVATDTLTLGFNVANAAASGVNLGRNVKYSPADTGHTTVSVFSYDGNGGATRAVAGGRVTEGSFELTAGELINGTWSFEGLKGYFNPIEITATDTKLDFTDSGASARVATITAKVYRDPHDLADALETAMNAASSADTHTVTFSDSTGKFTITSDGGTFTLDWSTGPNTANTVGDKIGFSVAADDTGATTYTSDNALDYSSPATPSLDSSDPLVAKNNEILFGSATASACIHDGVQSMTVSIATDKPPLPDACNETGRSGSVPTSRTVTVDLVANLKRHDADAWQRLRNNTTGSFFWAFGSKTASNWDEGKSGAIYITDCVVSSFNLADADGVITLELGLTGHVDSSGNGEVYLNLL